MFGLVGAAHSLILLREQGDRIAAFHDARAVAALRGKPLLNIGCPCSHVSWHGCGDVCLDVDPARLRCCRSRRPTVGDVRSMPVFPDKAFGAATCFHVLEHLPSVADGQRALTELRRVADVVVVLSPSRLTWIGWVHPEHRLWVNHEPDGSIWFEQRDRGAPDARGMVGPDAVKALWLAWQDVVARLKGA